ncbi:Signal transduction histidine kinase [Virgibacillus subterraneus]|uniref:histidine kinase n=1 Tax=Virgibacillus subterraneus TaxID=621109 RepID=A0A1H9FLH1_9BACI|nr:histidine kinase [Virgibacillus subterraneus]SEQ38716.1 Signal transduction histidine kinase [Virgibacillus subterraneus]
MSIFWVRFGIFCGLWTLLIFRHSENQSVSLLIAALALGLFFFLSIRKELLFLYISLSVIIFIHGIMLIDEVTYSILLLFFLAIIAVYRHKQKHLTIYLIFNLALSIMMVFYFNNSVVELIILSSFFYFMVTAVNRLYLEKNEQHELYEQMSGEYRKLKRMNLVAERDARLEERTKIARDIHDSVGYRLTALIMKLEILSIQKNAAEYSELKEMAQGSLDQTRQAVKALQSEEHEGLATVVHLIRKLEAESNIQVQFTIKQGVLSVPFNNNKSVVLYRVIQEALTNAMRHAQSKEVHINLGRSATGAISLEVLNQIYDAVPFKFGFGLSNMKDRVEEVNGTLYVYQTEEKFVVLGTMPVNEGEE